MTIICRKTYLSVRKHFIKIGRLYFLETRAPRSSCRHRYIYFNNVRSYCEHVRTAKRAVDSHPPVSKGGKKTILRKISVVFRTIGIDIDGDDCTKTPWTCEVRTVISREKNATARSTRLSKKKKNTTTTGKNNKNAPRRGTPRARLEGGWAGGWRHTTVDPSRDENAYAHAPPSTHTCAGHHYVKVGAEPFWREGPVLYVSGDDAAAAATHTDDTHTRRRRRRRSDVSFRWLRFDVFFAAGPDDGVGSFSGSDTVAAAAARFIQYNILLCTTIIIVIIICWILVLVFVGINQKL